MNRHRHRRIGITTSRDKVKSFFVFKTPETQFEVDNKFFFFFFNSGDVCAVP